MRAFRSLSILTLACAAALGACGPRSDPAEAPTTGGLVVLAPENSVRPRLVDFGTLALGVTREKVVRLENREGRPLTIQSVQAGCACTIPRISYVSASGERVAGNMRARDAVLVLPAGAVAELALEVDTRHTPVKNRDKIVLVRIVTDSQTVPYTTLDVRLRVETAFQAVPPAIELQRIAKSGGGEGSTEIAPILPDERVLLGVASTPPSVEAWIEPGTRPGGVTWTLHARVLPPLALGSVEAPIVLRTSGPGGVGEGEAFEVPVRYTAVEDVEVVPARILVARARPGAPEVGVAELVARLRGQRLGVVSSALAGEGVDALVLSVVPVAPDDAGRSERWKIEIAPKSSAPPGVIGGVVVIELDDPQVGRIEVPFVRRGAAE